MKPLKMLFLLLVAVSLSGCWWMESISYEIDLTNNICVYTFNNIISVPQTDEDPEWTEQDIIKDWMEFKRAFDKDSLIKWNDIEILKKNLNIKDDKLFCTIVFHFKSLDGVIKKDTINNRYVFKREIGQIISTNGEAVNDSIIVWPGNTNKLKFSILYSDENDLAKSYSLAPYFKRSTTH